MLRKIEVGWRRQEWLVSLRRSNLVNTSFIFVPGHAGVRGNERADRLAEKVLFLMVVQWTMLMCSMPLVRREEWRSQLEIRSPALFKDWGIVSSGLVRKDMNNTLAVKDEWWIRWELVLWATTCFWVYSREVRSTYGCVPCARMIIFRLITIKHNCIIFNSYYHNWINKQSFERDH
jgi:hypothetical protein